MADREKVIKGLEVCVDRVPGKYSCYGCPYEIDGNNCEINLAKDAIVLLNEQEPIWNDVLNVWTCPSCGQMVSTNYCRDCGKKVKWE